LLGVADEGEDEVMEAIVFAVANLSNSVVATKTKSRLFKLAQAHPGQFKSAEVLEKVARTVADYPLGLASRRFLHRLFDVREILRATPWEVAEQPKLRTLIRRRSSVRVRVLRTLLLALSQSTPFFADGDTSHATYPCLKHLLRVANLRLLLLPLPHPALPLPDGCGRSSRVLLSAPSRQRGK